ncbi:MAG: ABC transporter substrate-binding protein [Actinobacteria bacterium]|nr:ABC transporter substrate-binding protein [Actinomycetota bacterium]
MTRSSAPRRTLQTLALAATLLLGGAAAAQNSGGTLVAAWAQEPVGFDPHITSAMSSYQILTNVIDNLVTLDAQQNIVPELAESWTVSDDGLTMTFDLRDGVAFSNGTPLVAGHFKTVFDRLLDPDTGSGNAWRMAGVESVEAPDDSTVVLNLSAPTPGLLGHLAVSKALGVFDPVSVEDGTINTRPIGTGPFMITDFQPGTRILLEKNPNYWRDGLPYLDAVDIRILGDETVRRTALVTGEVDWVFSIPAQSVAELQARDDVIVDATPAGAYYYIGVNVREGPLADERVRQAIAYAINRDNIVQAAEFGNAQVTQDPIPENSAWAFGYAPYEQNLDRARELLAEAGYADGFEMAIMPTTEIQATIRAAQVVQADLAAVGIRSNINTLEWAEWLQEQGEGNFDTFICSWNGLVDPDDFFYAQHRTGEVFNFTGYSNPTVDELLDEGRVLADFDQRFTIYEQVNQHIVDEAPYIYLYNPLQIHAYAPYVQGFQTRADQSVRFHETWLEDH